MQDNATIHTTSRYIQQTIHIHIRNISQNKTKTKHAYLWLRQVDALRYVGNLHRAVREDNLQQIGLEHLVIQKVQVVRNQVITLQVHLVLGHLNVFSGGKEGVIVSW